MEPIPFIKTPPTGPVSPEIIAIDSPPPRKKRSLWGIILLVVLIALAGGAYGAYKVFFAAPNAEKILSQMFAALTNVETYEYSGNSVSEIDYTYPGDSVLGTTTLTIALNGVLDVRDRHAIETSNTLSIQAKAGNSTVLGAELEYRRTKGADYIKLNSFTFAVLPIDMSAFIGTWISLDSEDIAGAAKRYTTLSTEAFKEPSDADVQRIKDIIATTPWLDVSKRFPDEAVAGTQTHRYAVGLNTAATKKALLEILALLSPGQKPSPDQEKALDEALRQISGLQIESWIGVTDLLPYKTNLHGKLSFNTTNSANVKAEYTFRNYNAPVTVVAPDSARSFKDAMADFMRTMMEGSAPPASPEGDDLDPDLDGLTNAVERGYGTNPNKADTDGDGFNDGAEIKNGYNPTGAGKLPNAKSLENDAQRIIGIRRIQSALGLYFEKNSNYPAGPSFAQMAAQLFAADLGISGVPSDPIPGRSYVYGPGNCFSGICLNYVVGVLLENSSDAVLKNDVDGTVYGVNCADPAYCVKL
jgi:hypothetical protein